MGIKIKSPAGIVVQSSGSVVSTDVDILNFNGAGVSVDGGGRVTITSGGGSGGSPSLSVINASTSSGSGSLTYVGSTGVLTYTPPNLTSFLTGITSLQITNALGYTPYNSTNPNGYTSNLGTVVSVQGTGSINGITLSGMVTSSGSLTLGGSLSNIANSQLVNSTISGVALGSNLATLTIGTGLSGTSYNGGTAVTIANAGVTSIVAGAGVVVTASTGDITISTTSSPTFTNVTTGTIFANQIAEPFQTYSASIAGSSPVVLDCSGGNIWRITSSVANPWTAAFTNVNIATGRAVNLTLIIQQGTTPYIPSTLSINGISASIVWQGGVLPVGNTSKTDAVAYSVMQTSSSSYVVLGQVVSFG